MNCQVWPKLGNAKFAEMPSLAETWHSWPKLGILADSWPKLGNLNRRTDNTQKSP
jgi:hypothetical protein